MRCVYLLLQLVKSQSRLSSEDIAAMAGMSIERYRSFLNNTQQPTADEFCRIVEAAGELQVTVIVGDDVARMTYKSGVRERFEEYVIANRNALFTRLDTESVDVSGGQNSLNMVGFDNGWGLIHRSRNPDDIAVWRDIKGLYLLRWRDGLKMVAILYNSTFHRSTIEEIAAG